ncbi:HlyD family efflux transporter periplasmic adaptor subunit [Enterovibrio nigricans]|uniref:HlyD family secretion protein n=1 Tax=Enterovibrio nigricans DSM 22720 TaxID=1121868 RepID=A0A1T4V2Q9_9GAMM|nr:HlyD family efflux transporter periplasmic adaptor subunit [Enterovibrio nigricans]PKF48902.1 hypothetical protein AT251_22780 [Enterovibrio nigricans]SKA59174.1 HlyD family secretion protein [Enterovibrio nigricans DSM 22720]
MACNIARYFHATFPREGEGTTSVTAMIKPRVVLPVVAQREGKIDVMNVQHGQRVTVGQKLVQFKCDKDIALSRKMKEVAAYYRKWIKSYEKLAKKNLANKEEIDNKRILLSKSEVDLLRINESLSHCEISSEIDGRVVEKYVSDGQYVSAGTPVLELISKDVVIEALIDTQLLDVKSNKYYVKHGLEKACNLELIGNVPLAYTSQKKLAVFKPKKCELMHIGVTHLEITEGLGEGGAL